MTLDWKKFDDEVQTEPRSVVTGRRHCGERVVSCFIEAWTYVPESRWWASDGNGMIYIDHTQRAVRWREAAFSSDVTHWAYVDPPEEA